MVSGVFVSYARANQVLARRLRNGLASLGVQVVWDEAMPGTDWQDYIATTIGELVAVVVLWTPESMLSVSVRDEARLGLDTGKLINVKSGVDKPKFPFDRLNALPLEGWMAGSPHAGWRRIVQTLDGKLASAGARASGELIAAYEAQLAHARDQRSLLAQSERKITRLRKEFERQQFRVTAAATTLSQADDQLVKLKAIQASTAVLTAATGDRENAESRYDEAHALLLQQEDALELELEAAKNASNDFAGWLVEVGGSNDPVTDDSRSGGIDDQSARHPSAAPPLPPADEPDVTQPAVASDEDWQNTPDAEADPDCAPEPASTPEAPPALVVDDEVEDALPPIEDNDVNQQPVEGPNDRLQTPQTFVPPGEASVESARPNRTLRYGAVGAVALVALVLVFNIFGGDGASDANRSGASPAGGAGTIPVRTQPSSPAPSPAPEAVPFSWLTEGRWSTADGRWTCRQPLVLGVEDVAGAAGAGVTGKLTIEMDSGKATFDFTAPSRDAEQLRTEEFTYGVAGDRVTVRPRDRTQASFELLPCR